MLKNNFLMIMLSLFLATFIQAQSGDKHKILLETMEQGTYNKVDLKDQGKTVGQLIFEKLEDGSTQVYLDILEAECRGVRLDYMRGDEVYFTDFLNENGPNAEGDVEVKNSCIKSETILKEDQEFFPLSVLGVALCCIEISIEGSTTIDENGCPTTTTAWHIGVDCDCFSISFSLTSSDGTQHSDVDEIIITLI